MIKQLPLGNPIIYYDGDVYEKDDFGADDDDKDENDMTTKLK